jgi:triosephosphate isomerase (TIM)
MPQPESYGGSPPTGRRPLISGNWKMHHNHLEAIQVVQKLSYRLASEDYEAVDVSVHPTFTALRSIQLLIDDQRIPIALGAQNCHWEEKGAFTGEISVPMLAKLDVVYVIVGHSERRELFGETDDDVRRKLEAVIAGGMTPIVCVGETLEERESGSTEDKVRGQVEAALKGLPTEQVAGLVIAYEPIWAIGTGRTATPDDAQATIGLIRQVAAGLSGDDVAARIRIQYGGSVKPTNIAELMDMPDIDGALVGGASLDADDFARIVQYRSGG